MTKLAQRKSKLIFETGAEIRERGKRRPISIEAHDLYAEIRLKGTRKRFLLSWEAVYAMAAKAEANRVRAEKLANKKAGSR